MAGRFQKVCAAAFHDNNIPDSEKFVCVHPAKNVSVEIANWFFTTGEISDSRRKIKSRLIYVCEQCITRAKTALENTESMDIDESSMMSQDADVREIDLEKALEFIDNVETLADAYKIHLAVCKKIGDLETGSSSVQKQPKMDEMIVKVGCFIQQVFMERPKLSPGQRLQLLKTATYDRTWNNEHPSWKLLLNTITSSLAKSERTTRLLVKATDCVRAILDPQFISPLSHAEAILALQLSHSRYVVEIFAHTQPSGSYSTIKRTIQSIALIEHPIPTSDIIIGFDNNQVWQRQWSIQFKGKQKSTTVTSVVLFQETKAKNLQNTVRIPSFLDMRLNHPETLFQRYKAFHEKSQLVINKYRLRIIEDLLPKIQNNPLVMPEQSSDEVTPLENDGESLLSYNLVEEQDTRYTVKDIKCLPVNPASTISVKKILDEMLAIKGNRSWLLVYMDGSPYQLAQKLVANTFLCSKCNSETTDIVEHVKDKHKSEKSIKELAKYEGLILRPGNGHVEMLVVRCIIDVFWEPYILPVAKMMNFTSPGSLEHIRQGGDHHKSWQIITTVYFALLEEMLYEYKKDVKPPCIPNSKGFFVYSEKRLQTNIVYKLTYSFVFEVLTPLFIFRSALRQANDEVTFFARDVVTRILFGSSHPKYQSLLANDTFYLLSLPENKRILVNKESCRTVKSNIGQPFDFIVEERNKLQKSYLPSDGAPSFTQWDQVCKSMHELELIREITTERLGIVLQASEHKQLAMTTEKIHARKYFNENLNLSVHNVTNINSSQNSHVHNHFADFYAVCKNNQLRYFGSFINGEVEHVPNINNAVLPVDVSSLSKDRLFRECTNLIKSLTEPNLTFYRRALKAQTTLEEFREFYAAILRQLSIQSNLEGAYDFD